MKREYCKQDVFRCNTTGETLVFSCELVSGINADFVNATDCVERDFDGLTYMGRNPNIVLTNEVDPNGLYYVYGREETFKSDQRYRFHSIDERDKSQSFKICADNGQYKFWAKVISKLVFTSLWVGLYNPFNCESPKKEFIITDESGSLSEGSNKTELTTLVKQPKALI